MILPDYFILALIAAECACGVPEACTCTGDGGRAIGPLQIHQCVIDDVNRIYGTSYSHKSMRQLNIATWVCRAYLKHYCSKIKDRYYHYDTEDHLPTLEDAARIWNGGPNGYKKDCTINYWKKRVEPHLP